MPMRAPHVVLTLIGSVILAITTAGPAGAQTVGPDSAIRLSQHLIQRNPADAHAYYRLGDAYIQKARETGDVTYFNLAEEALKKSLAIGPRSSAAVRHLAFVHYSRHEFAEAATEATRAIELDPANRHAYGILGDAQLEVGRYAEAERTYGRMAALGMDLYPWSRLSGLKSVTGDPEGAIADLKQAIADGQAARVPRESIAWAQWQLATECFNLGRLEAAEAGYEAALITYPRYHRALAGLGQVRAAQSRYPEAIALYEQAIGVIPQPDYVAALGDVFQATGRTSDAVRQYALVEYIGRLSALNRVLYNRELAYFYTDHDVKLGDALELAERELDIRRDIYAYDVLAWARYKSGNPEAAREAMGAALRLGTHDARLFFHAGLIERRLGDWEAAREYLERALATNPHFHVIQADLARRALTELGGTSALMPTQEARHGW
jgi:tetratricopeptide (TPR) repeat protein